MVNFIHCRTLNSQSAVSISVANLAAVLHLNNYKSSIFLLKKNMTVDALSLLDKCKNNDIIIAKINYQDYGYIMHLLQMLKKNNMTIHIILMGVFATLNYKTIISKYQFLDGIILGAGESNIVSIVESINKDGMINPTIQGGAWITPDGLIIHEAPTSIPMNELPLPIRAVEKLEKEALGNLEFSRGCTLGCRYCHISSMRKYQSYTRDFKTVDQVINDIQEWYSIGKRYLIFNDSVFWNDENDNSRIEDLCNRIIDLKLSINFMIYLSLSHFPPIELISLMRNAGLIRIFIGVESNNETDLVKLKTSYQRQISFDDFVSICKTFGITYHIGYMVFFPFSTFQEVKNSIQYLIQINKIHRVGIILAKMRLIPSSIMCKQYLRNNDVEAVDKALLYNFDDIRVENLYNALNYIFRVTLKGYHANNELLCCSLDLIEEICIRKDSERLKLIKADLEKFINIKSEYQKLLETYIISLVNYFENPKVTYDVDEISRFSKEFVNDFLNCREEMQFYWSKLINRVDNAYNINIEKQIFTER